MGKTHEGREILTSAGKGTLGRGLQGEERMQDWTQVVQTILEKTPARAMVFSRLLRALAASGVAIAGREDWFLRRLTEQPEEFKVIPDRLGPWVSWPEKARSGFPAFFGKEWLSDPWIMTCSDPNSTGGDTGQVESRVRESLQAWGKNIDVGSQVAVARWIQAILEAERALGGG